MTTTQQDRYTTLIGNITFAILAILSLIFWRERTIMLDAAFQSFYVINDGKLAIQVDRFGAAFVQSFPLLASKLGFSLKTILIFYSLSFVIFHWLCFFICDKVLKVKPLALAILLYYTLMTAHTFYWIQNEIIQATSLLLVLFAYLISRGSFARFRWFDYPLSIALVFTVYYFHPLVMFPFAFLVAYFFTFFMKKTERNVDLTKEMSPLSMPLIFGVLVAWAAAWATKQYVTGVSWYDKGSSGRFETQFKNTWEALLTGNSAMRFWRHCSDEFILVIPVFISIVVFYLFRKQFLRLLVFVGASLGLVFIVSVSYFDSPDFHWFYLESQYLPLAAILAVPLALEIYPSVFSEKTRPIFTKIAVPILCILLTFKLLYIFQTSKIYTDRLDYIGQLLDKTKRFEATKFLGNIKDVDERRLGMPWALAFETLYFSATQSPDSCRTMTMIPEPEKEMWVTGLRDKFSTLFGNFEFRNMNRRLFHFPDSTRGYHLLVKKDLD